MNKTGKGHKKMFFFNLLLAAETCRETPWRSQDPHRACDRPEERRSPAGSDEIQNMLWWFPESLWPICEVRMKRQNLVSNITPMLMDLEHTFMWCSSRTCCQTWLFGKKKLTCCCGPWWGRRPSDGCWAWRSKRPWPCAWTGCCNLLRTLAGDALCLSSLFCKPVNRRKRQLVLK